MSSVLSFLMLFNLEFLGVLLLFFLMKESTYMDEEYWMNVKNSDINFWMTVLVVVLFLMMMMIEFSYKMSMNLMFIILYMLMLLNDFISFFLFYEMIFILIMFSILMLGYSYERLMAGFLMLFYSFMFSSPVMMMLLLFDYSFLMKEWLCYSSWVLYFFVGSFMVKFPVFGFHYWLPIAHVEASTVGSMILAGLLLKVGSVGLMYIIWYMNFMMKFHWMSLSVVLVMLMIISLSDLKLMIAYSSVAHMTMVFYIMMLGYNVGKKGSIYMMFYHGFVSPLMFWVVGMLMWFKTRSLMVVKVMSFSYNFILILFFLCILNMGFPPFMGFMSEILMLKAVLLNQIILMVLIFSVLLSCYYNVYLFWCFNSAMGMVYKINFFSIDLFMFMLFVLFLNM